MVVPPLVALAAERGALAVVQGWLDTAGPGAANDVCADGYTCLLRSVAYGDIEREDVELACFLISNGADVNLCCPEGWAPLHDASFYGHTELVRLLLNARAGTERADRAGFRPLDLALRNGHSNSEVVDPNSNPNPNPNPNPDQVGVPWRAP